MDMKKTGAFLKELRKEKNITQEQLAEKLFVSGRTVSRWETGSNLPDLDVLIELADLYGVDIRELIDGERKPTEQKEESDDTLKRVAEYAENEKKMLAARMFRMTSVALIMFVVFLVLDHTGLAKGTNYWQALSDYALGLTLSALVLNLLYISGILDKIREVKQQRNTKGNDRNRFCSRKSKNV